MKLITYSKDGAGPLEATIEIEGLGRLANLVQVDRGCGS